jgi:hypothetical protein
MSRSDISEPVSLAVLPTVSFPAINLKSAMLAFGRKRPIFGIARIRGVVRSSL